MEVEGQGSLMGQRKKSAEGRLFPNNTLGQHQASLVHGAQANASHKCLLLSCKSRTLKSRVDTSNKEGVC